MNNNDLKPSIISKRPFAITIGVFDGCHLGHRFLFSELLRISEEHSWDPAVVTFDPHPDEVVVTSSPEGENRPIRRLFQLEDNLKILRELGFSRIEVIAFDKQTATLTAEEFLAQLIVPRFELGAMVVGYDFALGKGREGDSAFLRDWCRQRNVMFHQIGAQKWDATMALPVSSQAIPPGSIISSSLIRQLLDVGAVEGASRLLGQPFFMRGKVEIGQKLGRKLGFPTANLKRLTPYLPKVGVYGGVCKIMEVGNKGETEDFVEYLAAINIGYRPTVTSAADAEPVLEPKVECHLLDFSGDLYGQELKVEFHCFLRDEKEFSSIDHLKTQIYLDVEKVRRTIKHVSTIPF